MDNSWVIDSLRWMGPELILVTFILIVIIADLMAPRQKWVVGVLAAVGMLLAFVEALVYFWALPAHPMGDVAAPTGPVFLGAYAIDGFSYFLKITFAGAGLIVALFSMPALRGWKTGHGEYFTLLLACTFGMVLMSSANDLLMMYLSLEFVSVTSYIMAGLLRRNRKSAEASLKYIIYGAAASGFMIYGMSFLYGLTGTLEIAEIGARLAELNVSPTLTLITSVLIMAGFAYKIAAVPFHMWCPDVYEGAPTPVTAFFSVGPKAAGFAMLVRFLANIYPEPGSGGFEWKLVIALLAVLTLTVGNFGALHQQNLKRLLAYSSIAHAGYLLVALMAFDEQTGGARAALVFYIVTYIIMNLGAFLIVLVMEQRYGIETVDGCRGFGWRSPQLGILMTVFLFSLTGLPPTAGFVAKLIVFKEVIEHGIKKEETLGIVLVVIAAVFTVISLFYYMRIVAAMFLVRPRESDEAVSVPTGWTYAVLLWLLAIGTVGLGVAWGPLREMTLKAAKHFLPAGL